MGDISAALQWMLDQAEDPHVGYSQDFRSDGPKNYDQVKNFSGYASDYEKDWSGLSKNQTITYYDCSSAISEALYQAGYDTGHQHPDTANIGSLLKKVGFTELATGAQLRAGDIGVKPKTSTRGGHTAMITGDCKHPNLKVVHAHGRHAGPPDESYTSLKNQFCTNDSYNSSFNHYYRDKDASVAVVDPVKKDLNLNVIAAICGNFHGESNFNPGAWEDNSVSKGWTSIGKGFGLGQWTNTNNDSHGRLYSFYQWAIDNNWKYYSGQGQTKYLFYEAEWHDYVDWQIRWDIHSLDEFFNLEDKSLEWLVECWCNCWEGLHAGNAEIEKRLTFAEEAYDYIQQHQADKSIKSWHYVVSTSDSQTITHAEELENAVLFYRVAWDEYNEIAEDSDAAYTGTEDADYEDAGAASDGDEETVEQIKEHFDLTSLLYAMLGNGGSSRTPLHIIRRRR